MEQVEKANKKRRIELIQRLEYKMRKTENIEKKVAGKLLVVIRIAGMVKVKSDVAETLDRLRLRRKYACVLVDASRKEIMKMIDKVRYHVAYGIIEKDVLIKLIDERGQFVGEKVAGKDVADDLINGVSLEKLGLKPFFRLHPPRKGIKSKLQYPKGVLGNNGGEINKLLGRML